MTTRDRTSRSPFFSEFLQRSITENKGKVDEVVLLHGRKKFSSSHGIALWIGDTRLVASASSIFSYNTDELQALLSFENPFVRT